LSRGRRIWVGAASVVGGALGLAALGLVGGTLWLRSSSGNAWIADLVRAEAQGAMVEGTFALGGLETDLFRHLRVRDVRIRDGAGRTVVGVDVLDLDYRPRALMGGELQVDGAIVEGLVVDLSTDASGQIDLLALFGVPPTDPDEPTVPFAGIGLDLDVRALTVADAQVRFAGADGQVLLELADLALSSAVRLDGRNATLEAFHATTQVEDPVSTPVGVDGEVALVAGALLLEGVEVRAGASSALMRGSVARVETAPAFGVVLEHIHLTPQDVEQIAGDAILQQDVTLRGRAQGPLSALGLNLSLDAAEAGRAAAGVELNLESPHLEWRVGLETQGLDLDAVLVPVTAPVHVAGTYTVDAKGTQWPDDLEARFTVNGLEQVIWGEPIQDIALKGAVADGVIQFEKASAQHRYGHADVTGTVDVPNSKARVSGAVRAPSLARFATLGAPPDLEGAARYRGVVAVDWSGSSAVVDLDGRLEVDALATSGVSVARLAGPVLLRSSGGGIEGTGDLVADEVLVEPSLSLSRAELGLAFRWSEVGGAEGRAEIAADGLAIGDGAVGVESLSGTIEGGVSADGTPRGQAQLVASNLLLGPAEVEAEGGPIVGSFDGRHLEIEFDLVRHAHPFLKGLVRGDLNDEAWTVEGLEMAPIAERPFRAEDVVRFRLREGGLQELDAALVGDAGRLVAKGTWMPRDADGTDIVLTMDAVDLAAVSEIVGVYVPGAVGRDAVGLSGELGLNLTLRHQVPGRLRIDLEGAVEDLVMPERLGLAVAKLDVDLSTHGPLTRPELWVRVRDGKDVMMDLRGEIPVRWTDVEPALGCGDDVELDLLLAPGKLGRFHQHIPAVPKVAGLGSGWLRASGDLCDPDLALVSTWSLPVGVGNEHVRFDVDVERAGDVLEVWGAVEEAFARRLVVEGGADTPASTTIAALLDGDQESAPDVSDPEAWVGDLSVRVVPLAVPLDWLAQLAELDVGVAGRLQGGLSLTGTVLRPVVAGALMVDSGRIGPVPLSEAQLVILPAGEAGYEVTGQFGFGEGGALGDLSLDAKVPLVVDLNEDRDTMLQRRGLNVRLDGEGFPLSVIEGAVPGLEEASGRMRVAGDITGTLADPVPSLRLDIEDGLATHRDLGLRYRDINGVLKATGDELVLESLSLRTDRRKAIDTRGLLGDSGSLSMSGRSTIVPSGLGDVQLEVTAEEFWLADTPELLFRLNGDLEVEGTWPNLRIGGGIEMMEGKLVLDEQAFLQDADLALDPVLLIRRGDLAVGQAIEAEVQPFWSAFEWDVNVDLHRGMRFVVDVPLFDRNDVTSLSTAHLDAELASSELRALTKAGELVVNGRVELPRGELTLFGSKFVLASERDNVFNFISDDYLEPTIDLTAVKTTRSYGAVEARILGTPDAPDVSFESTDYPDETDIMSILLFGKPASELSDSEGQSGAAMLGTALSMVARSSLNKAFGSSFRAELAFEDDAFRVGFPIRDRFFASVEIPQVVEEDDATIEVTLEWLISRRMYAELMGGDAGTSADMYWRWRF
jgi:hypothetical protein